MSVDPAELPDDRALQDNLEALKAKVGVLRKEHASALHRVERARESFDDSAEKLADMQRRAWSGPPGGSPAISTRQNRDAALLESKSWRDVPGVEERLLELQILNKQLQQSIDDVASVSEDWKHRRDMARKQATRIQEALKQVPGQTSTSVVEVVDQLTRRREEKRGLEKKLEERKRNLAHQRQIEADSIDHLAERVSALDRQMASMREQKRDLKRARQSKLTRIEALEAQQREWADKLRKYLHSDDLLRVSFKRYDRNNDGTLDRSEFEAALRDLRRAGGESAQLGPLLEEAGDRGVDFRGFRQIYRRLCSIDD